jgi:hypothetical protein
VLCCLLASSLAMVVQNLPALAVSLSPRAKKNVAPSRPCCARSCATVLAIVDFPAPAMPSSQNMVGAFSAFNQEYISPNTCLRVPARHLGIELLASETCDAPAANGNLSMFLRVLSSVVVTKIAGPCQCVALHVVYWLKELDQVRLAAAGIMHNSQGVR